MDRRKCAAHLHGRAQLFEGQIRLLAQQAAQLLPMAPKNLGLGARILMPGPNVSGSAPLLKEFLHHPQRDLEPGCYLCPGALLTIVGAEDAFPQIHRPGAHTRILTLPEQMATVLFKPL